MNDTVILNIYESKYFDWVIVNTEKGFYSLRLGGFKKESELELDEKDQIDFPYNNKRVKKIYSEMSGHIICLMVAGLLFQAQLALLPKD